MNLTIKEVPASLHHKLKAQADTHNRSLNREVIDILEKAVLSQPVDVEALLAEVASIRSRVTGPPLTEELLRQARNVGRP